jgi:glycerol-3-phosphate acyltransferase PlsY
MIAGATFPIIIIGVFKVTAVSLIIFSLAIAIMLLLTHQKNIERLLRREESRANLFGKRRVKKHA